MRPRIIERLRWTSDDTLGVAESRAVYARAFVYLYGAGASLVLLTLAFPPGGERRTLWVVVPALLAYGVVGVLIVRFDRLPLWIYESLPAWGAVLVSLVLFGGGGANVAAYAMMYVWVILSGHYFFSPRLAGLTTAWTVLLYGVVLAVAPGVTSGEVKWLMGAGALGVAGLLTSLLRMRAGRLIGRLERHAAHSDLLARLSRRAMEPNPAGALPREAAELVHRHLGAECASVLLLDPAREALIVVAAEGWRDDVATRVAPVDPGTLTGAALIAQAPVFAEHRPDLLRAELLVEEEVESSVLVPLRGRETVHGLLAAHARRPGAFSREDGIRLEAVAGVLASALDRARAAEKLQHQAHHDDLTGQPNRHLFLERLHAALKRSEEQGSTVAVLFLDLDNFKVLNDSLGHAAGDDVLVALVPRLRRALFLADTIARFSGDEFVVLCEGVDGEAGALAIAQRLHAALEEPFAISGALHRLTASIGVALGHGGTEGAGALLRNADAALARAKTAGRNRTALYDDGMHRAALERLRLENALRGALPGEQLRLVYQPIVDLEEGVVSSCEALLRWTHPELGEVSPTRMIPVAEETGLIVRIGAWVLDEAVRTAAQWRRLAGDVGPAVTVNVSTRQLAEPGFVAQVADALRTHGLPARKLIVEITESALIEDNSAATERIAQLRALGIRIALDDFGTGYSSLGFLRRFAVDVVKIDKSFVGSLADGQGGDTIVAAVLALTAGLGASHVAEGVETPEQLDRLREMGCRHGQGYLFARPLPPSDVESLVVRGGLMPVIAHASPRVA